MIREQDKQILSEIKKLFQRLGEEAYVVGGYVRNALLGFPPADMDLASPVPPDRLLAGAAELSFPATIVNRRLGTVELRILGERVEHTTFRRESYAPGGGHEPLEVEIGVSMEEDALRRDFSVNALYYNIFSERVEDPTGRGLSDMKRRRLRSTTADPADIIKDDALRLLRLVRFACELGFTIDPALFCAAREYAAQIEAISKERVLAELDKILLSDGKYPLNLPVPAPKRGLLYLEAMGILTRLVPEFAGYREVGACRYHKYNVFLHTVNTVAAVRRDRELRYAALFHDVGKPAVWKSTGKMLGHDVIGADIAALRLKEFRMDKKTAANVEALIRTHMYDLNGKARENKVRRKAQAMGYELFYKLADLREADFIGSGTEKLPVETAEKFRRIADKMKEEGTPMSVAELNIDGREIMERFGVSGPLVGEVLQALLDECVLSPRLNTEKKLREMAGRKILAKTHSK